MQLTTSPHFTIPKDVYSYGVEKSNGLADNNVLSVLQNEKGITVQEAADYVGVHFKELVDKFLAAKTQLPSFGKEVDTITS